MTVIVVIITTLEELIDHGFSMSNIFPQIVQLQELFDVRHSVFIIGNTGTGKSCVWRSLFKANQNNKKKPVATDLNPKAVTNDELFGIINPSTREWKDGNLKNFLKLLQFWGITFLMEL